MFLDFSVSLIFFIISLNACFLSIWASMPSSVLIKRWIDATAFTYFIITLILFCFSNSTSDFFMSFIFALNSSWCFIVSILTHSDAALKASLSSTSRTACSSIFRQRCLGLKVGSLSFFAISVSSRIVLLMLPWRFAKSFRYSWITEESGCDALVHLSWNFFALFTTSSFAALAFKF